MSGSIRDLRELICISRLNVKDDNSLETLNINTHNTIYLTGSDVDFIGLVPKCITQRNDAPDRRLDKIHLPGLKGNENGIKCHRGASFKNAPNKYVNQHSNEYKLASFVTILDYLDSGIVSNWLASSNKNIQNITNWISKSANFCELCHFWLSIISKEERKSILKRQYAIFIEELTHALSAGMADIKSFNINLHQLAEVIFHEYPDILLGKKANFVFVDYLITLTSTKKIRYKELLSDVRGVVADKQYVQGILAIRSFALISFWSGIVNSLIKLLNKNTSLRKPVADSFPECGDDAHSDAERMMTAMRLTYVDVVDYLITSRNVMLDYKDERKKNLFLHAVVMDRPTILKYLIEQLDESNGGLVNERADSGNTALHASVNMDNLECVELLLGCPYTNIDAPNELCNGATPLHLAIMHGRQEIVEALLNVGANPSMVMGDASAVDMGKKFPGNSELVSLLKSRNSKHVAKGKAPTSGIVATD